MLRRPDPPDAHLLSAYTLADKWCQKRCDTRGHGDEARMKSAWTQVTRTLPTLMSKKDLIEHLRQRLATDCNQFEQQLRAVAGLALGSTAQHSPVVMVNLLGEVWPDEMKPPDWSPVLDHPHAKLHLYGKRRALPKRKMGHFTVLAKTVEQALSEARTLQAALKE